MHRVCVFTGTRAEYGLLSGLLREVVRRPAFELQLIVSGTHLSPEFGSTREQVEADGYRASAVVEMLLSSDSPVGAAKSLALGVMGVAEALDRLRPDILVVLGDRYEALAAAEAALLLSVPVAHIGGGESTEGAVDESVRHAVTKLSHLHFVAAEPFARRVRQLGESPERIHVVGALGLDAIARTPLLDRAALAADLGVELSRPTFVLTYHPVTLSADGTARGIRAMLAALDRFPTATAVFTRPNADPGGREIRRRIDAYVAARPERSAAFTNLGQLRYLSLLRHADVVIGNSSSGIIEAPALRTPTVNIGERQRGRLRAASVLDAGPDADAVAECLRTALAPSFQRRRGRFRSPYGDGHAAGRIADVLAATSRTGLLAKRFHPTSRRPTEAG